MAKRRKASRGAAKRVVKKTVKSAKKAVKKTKKATRRRAVKRAKTAAKKTVRSVSARAGRGRMVKAVNYQRGSSNPVYDKRRHALPPGKRISRTGHVYWETRKNRSDLAGGI